MLIGVISYFLMVSAVLALVFLPAARAFALQRAQRLFAGGRAATTCAAAAGHRRLAAGGGAVGAATLGASGWFVRNARWIAFGLAVLATPPLAALALRGLQRVDGFDHTVSREANEQIVALLQGEQLVAPPTLPPELFATREVEQVRPSIRFASRQWELLDDDFRKRLLVVFKIMKEKHGYEMVLLEGYRSPERQTQLAALGSHVTQARAYESYHQYGLAADNAFMRDGRIVISERDPWAMRGYELYGETARSVGLVWGGGWRMKDFGHAELRRPGTLEARSDDEAPTAVPER